MKKQTNLKLDTSLILTSAPSRDFLSTATTSSWKATSSTHLGLLQKKKKIQPVFFTSRQRILDWGNIKSGISATAHREVATAVLLQCTSVLTYYFSTHGMALAFFSVLPPAVALSFWGLMGWAAVPLRKACMTVGAWGKKTTTQWQTTLQQQEPTRELHKSHMLLWGVTFTGDQV